MTAAKEIQEIVEKCKKCAYIDKPPCKYKTYEKFVPKQVERLVISESPPPGYKESYLYNITRLDRLRQAIAKALKIDESQVIKYLLKKGIFWTTAIKCRPTDKKEIEQMRRKCVEILKKEIKILKPKRIVALGKIAQKSISEMNIKNAICYYHPLYTMRFKRHEIGKLRQLLS